mmetsp:Transcript_906/g.2117  ORF Transcript_906/g.2117 Transcript_906/m.2117 type:complete len:101 (+) Transcript_906:2779-3081(+)
MYLIKCTKCDPLQGRQFRRLRLQVEVPMRMRDDDEEDGVTLSPNLRDEVACSFMRYVWRSLWGDVTKHQSSCSPTLTTTQSERRGNCGNQESPGVELPPT